MDAQINASTPQRPVVGRMVATALQVAGVYAATAGTYVGSAFLKASEALSTQANRRDDEQLLLKAAGAGDFNAARRLLDGFVDPAAPTQARLGTPRAWMPLHAALANRHEAVAELLINGLRPSQLNIPEGHLEKTPLLMAAELGLSSAAQHLLSDGADPTIPSAQGVTAFMEFCRQGNVELVEACIQSTRTADQAHRLWNSVDADGMPAFVHALFGPGTDASKLAIVDLHKEHAFNVHGHFGAQLSTGLHLAAAKDDAFTTRLLIDSVGLDANAVSGDGLTPIMAAAATNSVTALRVLSTYDANLNAQRVTDGLAALHLAVNKNNLEAVRELHQSGANLSLKTLAIAGQPPMSAHDLARYLGHTQMLALLNQLAPQPVSPVAGLAVRDLSQRLSRLFAAHPGDVKRKSSMQP